MYWIFLIFFIMAVLVPDIVRGPVNFLLEERAEEILIFIMGALAFLVFIRNERKIKFQERKREQDRKKITQTVKDLVESYSYIGEVNRKMDIIMNIALGLTDSSNLDKKRELEIYESITSAANFLMKAERTCLRFVDTLTKKTQKEFSKEERNRFVKNEELAKIKGNVSIQKVRDCIIVASPQKINSIRSYLIICDYDEQEEKSPKNMEILKVFASQALFLYSYTQKSNDNK